MYDKNSLLSLKFIMSEAWKFLEPGCSGLYKDNNYIKFIWKSIQDTSVYYIDCMTKIVDNGKTVCRKLSSTIE
ncbi:hypothetical protein MXB_158 [Myxobolus squamalis]|nr:hypothetical protein MXB_158 [Myxobolus squamalis]